MCAKSFTVYCSYVQHIIHKNADSVWDGLKAGGYIFVAGNSNNMPTSVREAVRDIFVTKGEMSLELANDMLERMEREGKYQTETWSWQKSCQRLYFCKIQKMKELFKKTNKVIDIFNFCFLFLNLQTE